MYRPTRPHSIRVLEANFESKLQLSSTIHCIRNPTSTRVRNSVIVLVDAAIQVLSWYAETGMVKQIECFCAELQAYIFFDPSSFCQRHVKSEKSRANQSIPPEITNGTGSLKRKSRWIIPLIYLSKDRVVASPGHQVGPLTWCPGRIVKTYAIESVLNAEWAPAVGHCDHTQLPAFDDAIPM